MLPGLSESYMFTKARLVAALGISGMVVSIAANHLPPMPVSVIELFLLLGSEVLIGLSIGAIIKMVMGAIHTAGMIMSHQMGLAAAMLFDPSQGSQGSLVGVFLSLIALLLILTTNLHYVFLQGLIDSYILFKPGEGVPFGDFATLATKTLSGSFLLGFKIASPLVIMGLVTYLGAGVMSRLMPQMQVFFVLMPVQILTGFFVLMITLSGSMMWFMDYYSEVMQVFIASERL